VFLLGKSGYKPASKSRCFPKLDLGVLAECALLKDMVKSRRQFLRRLKEEAR
jgi:hypothetical protein